MVLNLFYLFLLFYYSFLLLSNLMLCNNCLDHSRQLPGIILGRGGDSGSNTLTSTGTNSGRMTTTIPMTVFVGFVYRQNNHIIVMIISAVQRVVTRKIRMRNPGSCVSPIVVAAVLM